MSLARALGASKLWTFSASPETAVMRLQPKGWQVALPPGLWPSPLAALPEKQRAALAPPWPDIWIATGRRSIPFSLRAKAWSGGRTFVVQTQDPKVRPERFDLVVPPAHDQLTGAHVFPIIGPPTYWSEADIAAAQARFPELADDQRPRVLVSIGGNSHTHVLTSAVLATIEGHVARLATKGGRFWVTVSRRTPEDARSSLRRLAAQLGARFWETETADGPNPYLAWLSQCDAALVTEDSANMLADPAFFAKPTQILRLDGGSPRFDRLHRDFIARGSARWFDGDLETWTYAPVREAERAADEILRLWLERQAATRGR